MSTHPMFDPIETVAVLWGAGTSSQHTIPNPAAGGRLFSSKPENILRIEGDGFSKPSQGLTRQLVHEIASSVHGRRLFVAVMDGHNGNTSKPWHLWEGRRNASRLLQQLAAHSERHSAPVDVFMLVAQDPAFIHRSAQHLPVGSRVVAVQTPDAAGRSGWLFNCLYGQNRGASRGRSWTAQPDAKDLLLDLLISDTQTMLGPPEIAVSGSPYIPLNLLWRNVAGGAGDIMTPQLVDWSHANYERDRHLLRTVRLMGHPAGKTDKVTSSWNYLALAAECFRQHEQLIVNTKQPATLISFINSMGTSAATRSAGAATAAVMAGSSAAGTAEDKKPVPNGPRPARRASAHEIAASPKWLRPVLNTKVGRRLLRSQ